MSDYITIRKPVTHYAVPTTPPEPRPYDLWTTAKELRNPFYENTRWAEIERTRGSSYIVGRYEKDLVLDSYENCYEY